MHEIIINCDGYRPTLNDNANCFDTSDSSRIPTSFFKINKQKQREIKFNFL